MIVAVFAFPAFPAAALAQQYLPQRDMTACHAHSHAQFREMSRTPEGVQLNGRTPEEDGVAVADTTQEQWLCQPLTAPDADGNTAATVIIPGSLEGDATVTNNNGTHGLTVQERAALLARAAMSTKLPDILSNAAFKARFTPGKKTAIVNYLTAHSGAAQVVWNRIQAGGDVDLQDVTVQQAIAFLRTGGVLNDSDVASALAPQALP